MRPDMRIAVLCAAALLFATPFAAQTVTRSELISDDTLDEATGRKELAHVFSAEPERVRVSVRCKLKRGSFSWRVESPGMMASATTSKPPSYPTQIRSKSRVKL